MGDLRNKIRVQGISMLPLLAGLLCVACNGGGPEEAIDEVAEEPGIFWQLEDDAPFDVTLDPFPPQAGSPVRVRVEVGPGDWHEGPYPVESLSYRIADASYGFEDWIPMTSRGHDDWTAIYEADVTFPEAGTKYLHFRLRAKTLSASLELTDYSLEVE